MIAPTSTLAPTTAVALAENHHHDNPFLLDAHALEALAPLAVVRAGLRCAESHRVLDVVCAGDQLSASVAGDQLEEQWQVEIAADDEAGLDLSCDCKASAVCEHIIAALVAFAAQQSATLSQAQSAAELAIEGRVQAGRTSVRVALVEGQPSFGTWTAQSFKSSGAALAPYRVQIRSLTERLNTCTCKDFEVNRLGTCKHIEAVLHQARRKRGRAGSAAVAVVHLDWNVPQAPAVRVRGARVAEPVQRLLDRHFDVGGFLRGSLPDAWYALERDVQALAPAEQAQVSLGEDASGFARRAAEELARRARTARVQTEIAHLGGHLPGMKTRLFPYQVEGVAFLAGSGRALLADDMGLGKTVQAIAAARWMVDHEGVRRVIVVCPASLKGQWAGQIAKFTGLEAKVVEGTAAARAAAYRSDATFLVVNYELLVRDQSLLTFDCGADLVIFDEAQRLKNWRTRTAQVVKAIPSRFAFVLSGTPLENRLADLYSVMQLVEPRVLGPLWRFELDFFVKDERGKLIGYRNLSELRRRLQGHLLRRQRDVVKDQLPERLDVQLDVPMSARQQALHDGALQSAGQFAVIAARRPLTPAEERLLLSALQQARMACNAAGLVDKVTEGAPKLDELGRILEDLCLASGRKVVVFSQWERMGAMAEAVAKGLGLGVARLHGSVPSKKRAALIERFEQDEGCQVFISTDAGGVGLNLQCASALVNLDLPWNPAVLDQRLGRIYRLGQKESVLMVLLVAADSYEQRVGALLAGKRHLFGQVIEGDATEDTVGLSKGVIALALKALQDDSGRGGAGAGGDVDADAAAADVAGQDDAVAAAEAAAAAADAAAAVGAAGDATAAGDAAADAAADMTEGAAHEGAGTSAAAGIDSAAADPVTTAVQALTQHLGARLERILVAGSGLLAVIDRVDDDAQALAESLAGDVAVAVLDARTHAALQRLGARSPVADATLAWQRPAAPAEPPMLQAARRKLKAADVLLGSECGTEAVALYAQAMLAVAVQRAGLDAAPDGATAVWLYGDLLPRGVVTAEQAAALLRAQALADAAAVPVALAEAVGQDARGWVGVL